MNSVLSSIEGKGRQSLHKSSPDGDRSNSVTEISSSFRTGLTTQVNSSACRDGQFAGSGGSRLELEVNRNLGSRKSKENTIPKTSFAVNQSKGVMMASAFGQEAQTRISSKAPSNSSALNGSDSKHMNPRKGTYQEILARARAAQEKRSVIGAIKHKPADKLGQREKKKQNAKQSYKMKRPPLNKPSELMNKAHSAQENLQKDICIEKNGKKRQRIDLNYKGTMKPSSRSLAQVGSAKFGMDSSTKSSSSMKSYQSRLRVDAEHNKTYVSDVEEDSEIYSSDASSDMEAAAFDLEEEEQQSLSVAKKEDEAAAAEELELKRKKAKRQKMLAQMAATVSKKRKL